MSGTEPVEPQPVEPEPVAQPAEPQPAAPGAASVADAAPGVTSTDLADGEWHRLHPATPLLRGGIALLAVAGIILVNLRDLWIEIIFGGPGTGESDFLVWIIEGGFVGLILLGVVVVILLCVGGFYLSWRMHTFRITDELVEVRSGVVFRTNRRARLDRVQGINITRSFFARLFGAAKLEVSAAGQDANVPLAYLSSATADALRRDILTLAAGTQLTHEQQAAAAVPGSIVDRRVAELLAPELDPALAAEESVVKMHPGRLFASIVLSAAPVILIVVAVVVGVSIGILESGFWIFTLIPGAIGLGGFFVSRFTRNLRYTIASTTDGIRVGYGLLSTSNETLPPGRIHAIKVSQPVLWRPFGWWKIDINKASTSAAQASSSSGQAAATILPVGTLAEAQKVLQLVLPALDEAAHDVIVEGITGRGSADDGFVNSPRRAGRIRWFSWARNGYAVAGGTVLLRRGRIWRDLTLVPLPRIQSVSLSQGPLNRSLRLATLYVQTVAGPVTPRLGGVDAAAAVAAFELVSAEAIASAASDTSHRWRQGTSAPVQDAPVVVSQDAEPVVPQAAEHPAPAPGTPSPSDPALADPAEQADPAAQPDHEPKPGPAI